MKKLLLSLLSLPVALASYAQCNGAFYDGFETGSYSPTWSVLGSQVFSVTTTNPAVGNYRLEGTGGSSTHLQGLSTSFAASTPSSIEWWICPQTSGSSHNYFLAGNASITATNCIVFCYYQSAGVIRFVSSVSHDVPATLNTWYHIELRNINWSAHTFDIYVNNALQYTAFPFRSATQNDVSRVHLYNFNAGTGIWDDVRIGNSPPISTASFTNVSCFGGSNGAIDQTVSSGTAPFTYAWSNSATTEDLVGVTAGTYSVTVTDNLGCTTTATYVVTEPTAIGATAAFTAVTCPMGADGSATAIVSGGSPGYTYQWSNGGVTATIPNLASGNYTYTVTDVAGCTATATVAVTEPPALIATATTTGDVCPGGSTTLMGVATGGTPNYSVNWLPGNLPNANETVSPSSTTTYTLEVTDANGCTTSTTTSVTVHSLPVVDLGSDTTLCAMYTMDAQNSGSLYTWSNGDTTQMSTVTASGTYAVTVTDMNGCMNSDSVNVTIDAAPNAGTISSTGGSDICVGDSVALVASGTTGTIDWWVMPAAGPFWQYVGSGNPFSPQTPTQQDVGQYYFMSIAANGVCGPDSSDVLLIEIHDLPMQMLGSDTAACSSVSLDAGNAGSSYAWSTADTTQMITATSSGAYVVMVTSPFGCMMADTVNVTINTPPVITASASSNSVCADDANVVLTATPAGGLWTGPGVAGNSFDPSIGAGTHTAVYSYTDTNGCAGSGSVNIVVSACVGVTENSAVVMNVYPNPNNGNFTVQLGNVSDKTIIEITDAEGRVVSSEQLNNTGAGATHEISMENNAAGIYLMRVTSGEQTAVYRIVVQR